MNTKPYKFQIDGANFIKATNGKALIAFEMGLGKSITALLHAHSNPSLRPIIIVTPASLKWNWERECSIHFGWRAEIVETTRPKEAPLPSKPKIVIVNYDILATRRGEGVGPGWLKALKKLNPQMLILDECFPKNTQVLTTTGWMAIGDIVKEKRQVSVASFNFSNNEIEFKKVTHYFRNKRTTRMLTVYHSDGVFSCTENHKIWTENRGYVDAINLKENDQLQMVSNSIPAQKNDYSILQQNLFIPLDRKTEKETQNHHQMQTMQKEHNGQVGSTKRQTKEELLLHIVPLRAPQSTTAKNQMQILQQGNAVLPQQEKEKAILFDIVQSKMASHPARISTTIHKGKSRKNQQISEKAIPDSKRNGNPENTIFTNDNQQPIRSSGGTGQDSNHKREQWNTLYMAGQAGRKRTTDSTTDQAQEIARAGMDYRTTDTNKSQNELSNQLQSGLGNSELQNRSRDRWEGAWKPEKESTGSKETEATRIVRVDRVEVHEQTDRRNSASDSEQDCEYVYCLEVEDNHNFFADGVLVSNCQYISNPTTLRSKAVRELCEGVPAIIALSGTPLTNRPIELWPILNILAPDKFPSRYAFAHRYCAAKRTHWGWDFSGASNLDELNRKLQPVMIRRRKADVLKDLPAKRRSVIPMELSNPKEYEEARDNFSEWLADRDPNRMERNDKANALVKIGHLKRLAARLKLPAALDWIDSFLQQTDEKLVVFGIHRESIVEAIHERYANSSIVTGAVTGKKRQLAIDKFLRDKKCRLFVGNIDAAGVGWSAKGVSNVAFVELPWSPGKLAQCEDRCHGIGRGDENKSTHSWTLVGRGTIEEKLADVLQKKQRNLSKVLDGKGNPDDLNIFDLLIKELGRKPLT